MILEVNDYGFEDRDGTPAAGVSLLPWADRILCVWLAAVLGGFLWLRVLESGTVRRLLSRGG